MKLNKTITALSAIMFMASAGMHANAQVRSNATMNNMQAVSVAYRSRKQNIVNEIFGSGEPNPYKHNWGFKNQRQYRKLVRQVPQIRRSKKCRIKSR